MWYQKYINQDPAIMVGKPVIKGTRIPVELILAHLAHNTNLNELFAAYPHITIKDVQACIAYGQAAVQEQYKKRRSHDEQDKNARISS